MRKTLTIISALLLTAANNYAQSLQAPLPEIVIQEEGETFTFTEPKATPTPAATPTPEKIEQPTSAKTDSLPKIEETPAENIVFELGEPTEAEVALAEEAPQKLMIPKVTESEPLEPIVIKEEKPTVAENPIPAAEAIVETKTEAEPNKFLFVEPEKNLEQTSAETPPLPIQQEKLPEPEGTIPPQIAEAPTPVATPTPTTEATELNLVETTPTPTPKMTQPTMELDAPPTPTMTNLFVVAPSPTPEETTPEENTTEGTAETTPQKPTMEILELPDIPRPKIEETASLPNQRPDLTDLAVPKESPNEGQPLTKEDVELLIGQLRDDGRKKEAARSTLVPNLRQEEINFDNVPLGAALRLLAEQAGFNFIEPALPEGETISLRFQKMTPLEAFMRITRERGFSVVTRDGVTTLRRADILTPEFLLVKKYNLRHVQPKWVIQQVANLLEIAVTPPAEVIASFPPPDTAATTYGGSGGSGGSGGNTGSTGGSTGSIGGSTGGSQNIGLPTAPRWTSSLPFDEPSYSIGEGNTQKYIFIDRNSRSLIIRASEGDHEMLKEYIASIDSPEPQIMIEAKVVEVLVNDDLDYGVDWSTMLQQGIRVSAEGEYNFDWGSIVLGAATGTPGQLTLSVENAEVTIRAFQRLGNGMVTNMPKTMTRSNVPVAISSTITDATPSYQISTTTGSAGSVSTPGGFNTFTTGMTIDLVPQLLANGMVDINVNPSVANKVGEQVIPAAGSTPEQRIPIISSRSITTSASVPSGMTIMIGGLTEVADAENNGGIPILSQIPLLGKTIFGNTSRRKVRKTMIMFVTPTIIYPDQYLKVYTQQREWEAMKESNRIDFDIETSPIPNGQVIKRAMPIKQTLLPPTSKKKN